MFLCHFEQRSPAAPRFPRRWTQWAAALLVAVCGGDAVGQTVSPHTPHPAVVRVTVPEVDGTAYGSGTLIDVRDDYGLVLTNWHVVCDASGPIEVQFPSGFVSQARALKVDRDWDLAALVIWRPPCQPVRLADRPPRPGDRLTICGYGAGNYRAVTGRCTQYYAPRMELPQELVELNVEARQGDSGGPIFNHQGELAGVLFGAGQGTTLGSFEGRVKTFLASLAPDIGQPRPDAAPQVALQPPGATRPGEGVRAAADRTGNLSHCSDRNPVADLASTPSGSATPAPADQPGDLDPPAGGAPAGGPAAVADWPKPSETHGWQSGRGATDAVEAWPSGDAHRSVAADTEAAAGATVSLGLWELAKNVLAVIGAVALLLQLLRLAG